MSAVLRSPSPLARSPNRRVGSLPGGEEWGARSLNVDPAAALVQLAAAADATAATDDARPTYLVVALALAVAAAGVLVVRRSMGGAALAKHLGIRAAAADDEGTGDDYRPF